MKLQKHNILKPPLVLHYSTVQTTKHAFVSTIRIFKNPMYNIRIM